MLDVCFELEVDIWEWLSPAGCALEGVLSSGGSVFAVVLLCLFPSLLIDGFIYGRPRGTCFAFAFSVAFSFFCQAALTA